MSCSYILLGSTLPFLSLLYQQHSRLARLYPTVAVPPHLDVGLRDDRPAVGKIPHSGELWRRYQGSDAWYVDLPRTVLRRGRFTSGEPSATEKDEVEPVVAFARAFWGSWPLVLEKKIMQSLIAIGIGPFTFRPGSYPCPSVEENNFDPGSGLVGNLFIVEAHDVHPKVNPATDPSKDETSGPVVISWWLKSQPSSSASDSNRDRYSLLGGYHSFSVQYLPHSSLQPDHVRCTFASHICMDSPAERTPSVDGKPTPNSHHQSTQDLRGLPITHKVSMAFHVFYSRILMDLAVRRMGVNVPWW